MSVQDSVYTLHADAPESVAPMVSAMYEPHAESLFEANFGTALRMVKSACAAAASRLVPRAIMSSAART